MDGYMGLCIIISEKMYNYKQTLTVFYIFLLNDTHC